MAPARALAADAAVLLSLAACTTQTGAPSLQGKPLSGYVQMCHVHAAYIGSGSAGDGTLTYMGHTYPFRVGGLGVGGIGVSTVQASGAVYGLRRLGDFPGAYAQIRYGFALGSKSAGNLWLQNGNGVDPTPGRQASGVDAEPGRRCGCDQHEVVTSDCHSGATFSIRRFNYGASSAWTRTG